jgi:succinoglycan biosynthesis protein ExoA
VHGPAEGEWPAVSVVMPVLDEERHLRQSVARVLQQDYPGQLEVVLALGPSRDATDAIAAELAATDPRVRLVANPEGTTPAGLNVAIGASRHPVVARVDAHGILPTGYLRRAVEVLEATGADNVGGLMVGHGTTPFEQAVARAYGSRIGLGGGPFHVGGEAGPAASVYLGVFRRAALERVTGFDESMLRAQDWELNYRIRRSGGVVWFDPSLQVGYRPRSTWRALARQYWTTGRWRRQLVRRHPDTLSPRYLAPPVAVLVMISGTSAGLAAAAGGPRWLRLGWAAPVGYVLFVVVVGGVVEGRGLPLRSRALLPLVLAVIHGCWGAGFLTARRRDGRSAGRRTRTSVPG